MGKREVPYFLPGDVAVWKNHPNSDLDGTVAGEVDHCFLDHDGDLIIVLVGGGAHRASRFYPRWDLVEAVAVLGLLALAPRIDWSGMAPTPKTVEVPDDDVVSLLKRSLEVFSGINPPHRTTAHRAILFLESLS